MAITSNISNERAGAEPFARLTAIVIGASIFATLITYVCVVSGFDWHYLVAVAPNFPRVVLFFADILGFLLPVFGPLGLFVYGAVSKRTDIRRVALLTAATALVALSITSFYKAIAGRESPPHHGVPTIDTSADFSTGFMNEGILGGWPSSHAAVTFSIGTFLYFAFPNARKYGYIAFALAAFISVGESIGFHWFSECVSGALIGVAIGYGVSVSACTRRLLLT